MASATLDPSAQIFKHLGAQGFAAIELDADGNVLSASSNAIDLFGSALCARAALTNFRLAAPPDQPRSGRTQVPLDLSFRLGDADVQARAKLLHGYSASTFLAIETRTLRKCRTARDWRTALRSLFA